MYFMIYKMTDDLSIDAIDSKNLIFEQFPDVFKQEVGCIPD